MTRLVAALVLVVLWSAGHTLYTVSDDPSLYLVELFAGWTLAALTLESLVAQWRNDER